MGRWLEEGVRLISVTGPAGVGKTLFATRVAQDSGLPVVFCDVSEARDGAHISTQLARSLELSGDTGGLNRIARALDARGATLVVLDNYEQVAPEADALLASWLHHSAAARLLVTSRRRLQLDGHHTLELRPLALPPEDADIETLLDNPAVSLFLERAVRGGTSIDDDTLPVIASIVRELDGLPLAIELAAAKCRLLTPSEVAQRLRDRFSLLTDRRGQRLSLRAALDASWGLLSPEARRGLARCSVFVGDWDLRAAEAVIGGGEDRVLSILGELHDQSLLSITRPEGGRRFHLYATLRQYAAEHAVAMGEVAEAESRHGHHYAEWGLWQRERLHGSEAETAIAELARELHNATAAVHWLAARDRPRSVALVVALAPVFEHQVPQDAYLDLLELTLGPDQGAPMEADLGGALRAQALLAKGRALAGLGRAEESREVLREALAVAGRGNSRATLAQAAIEWGWTCGTRGDDDGAAAAFARAAEALQATDAPWLEAHLWRRRGYLAYRRGEREMAETDMRKAVERFQALGARRDEASTLGWLGFVADGRPGRAIPYFSRAVEMLEELGDMRQLARHLQYLAVFQFEEGAHAEAEAAFDRALSLQQRMADRQQEAVTRSRRVLLWLDRGEVRAAVDELARALRQLDGEGDLLYRGEALAVMAAAEVHLGLVEAARGHLAQARDILVDLRYPALDALRLVEAHCDVAADAADATSHARALADDPTVDHSYALNRIAHRWLLRALGAEEGPELRVGPDFAWFEHDGERVSLARRAPMRRLLEALAGARERGDDPLPASDLIEAGWPGENLVGSSGEARLYTTVRRMRQLGLADFLHHDGAGYCLTGRLVREGRA